MVSNLEHVQGNKEVYFVLIISFTFYLLQYRSFFMIITENNKRINQYYLSIQIYTKCVPLRITLNILVLINIYNI